MWRWYGACEATCHTTAKPASPSVLPKWFRWQYLMMWKFCMVYSSVLTCKSHNTWSCGNCAWCTHQCWPARVTVLNHVEVVHGVLVSLYLQESHFQLCTVDARHYPHITLDRPRSGVGTVEGVGHTLNVTNSCVSSAASHENAEEVNMACRNFWSLGTVLTTRHGTTLPSLIASEAGQKTRKWSCKQPECKKKKDWSLLADIAAIIQAALERQDLSCAYLAHHELESNKLLCLLLFTVYIYSICSIYL